MEIFPTQGHYDTPACWDWPPPSDRLKALFPEHGDLLEAWHENRCAVCGGNVRATVEDHDHDTGLTRGYLCRSCNNVESRHNERGCIYTMYRSRTPAMILGIQSTYVNMFGRTPMRPAPLTPEQEQELQRLIDHRWESEEKEESTVPNPNEKPCLKITVHGKAVVTNGVELWWAVGSAVADPLPADLELPPGPVVDITEYRENGAVSRTLWRQAITDDVPASTLARLIALEKRVAELEAWKFAREEYEMEMRERES